jgi:hypothetical protein
LQEELATPWVTQSDGARTAALGMASVRSASRDGLSGVLGWTLVVMWTGTGAMDEREGRSGEGGGQAGE